MAMAIEKGVPIPDSLTGGPSKYPFRKMEIGDSFFTSQDRDTLSSAATYARSRYGLKFSIRKTDGGFRVWRVA